MNYQQTLDYLYSALPMYQRVGQSAFKKDLTNTIRLCAALGNPEKKFKSIHIAGTNGKGSSSHMLASVLQSAGYKVGLYTSPHLKSFTERIRINGQPISEQAVVDFVHTMQLEIEAIQPSFFEMTVAMAFDYFAKEKVDIAVVEVGLGGRLDSTNIIRPEVSLITNIGFDHMDMLGDTLAKIAAEKAGIIKKEIPVVIGESQNDTVPVFTETAKKQDSPIIFADQLVFNTNYELDLQGSYQSKNIKGVLATVAELRKLGWHISEENLAHGLAHVRTQTGLKGRWHILSEHPLVVCDTGHNNEAFNYIIPQIKASPFEKLYMVLGFVSDKKLDLLIPRLPKEAEFVFCQAKVPRAMKLEMLKEMAAPYQLRAHFIEDVNEAISFAKSKAGENDMVYIGGSTFVVAEIEEL